MLSIVIAGVQYHLAVAVFTAVARKDKSKAPIRKPCANSGPVHLLPFYAFAEAGKHTLPLLWRAKYLQGPITVNVHVLEPETKLALFVVVHVA